MTSGPREHNTGEYGWAPVGLLIYSAGRAPERAFGRAYTPAMAGLARNSHRLLQR